MEKKKTFKSDVILKLSEWVKPDKNNKYELRLIRWIVDGVPKSVKLERRSYYVDQNQWKMGKVEGLSYADMKVIQENMPKIMEIMSKHEGATASMAAKSVVDTVSGSSARVPNEEETSLPF